MWYSKFALISTLLKSNVIFLCLHVCSFYLNFIACLTKCVCRPLQDVADISSGVSVSVRKRAT